MKIFDAHFHIINPDFPLVENNGYLPPNFTINDYAKSTKELKITGGAVVSGSFQAFNQGYLIDALQALGPQYCGVANIPFDMPMSKLIELKNANIRAVRFNLKRGGSEKLAHMKKLSNKLFDEFNWHTELYVDSVDLPELSSHLKSLPKFSIDHLGLSKRGLLDMYKWAEKGIKIKATGFGRIDFPVLETLKKINEINPHCLMFGTDLPSTRAKIPFSEKDIQLFKDHFSLEEQNRIFYQNAQSWYFK